MWSPLIICLVAGLATADYAWKPGTEYKYQIRGRTLASLHQVADKYVGVLSRATLKIQAKSSNEVYAWISDAQYAQVQTSLPGGWTSRIPDKELSYKSLPISSKPFEIKYKNGVVDKLVVSKGLPTAEINLLKSVVSQLQVDTEGANRVKGRTPSNVPNLEAYKTFYPVMEDTVTGECNVWYDISRLPEYAFQETPELVPMPNLRGDGHFYDIVKTKNFSHCAQRPTYHWGFTGLTPWEPADNRMDNFLSRSSVSRIVISGDLKKYTIQSSVTTARIIVSPMMYNAQKGMVGSRMNVTLVSVHSASGSPPAIANPRTIKDLVYEYNTPFSSEQGSDSKRPSKPSAASDNSESSSSSSSEDDSADSDSDSQNSSSTSESSEDSTDKRKQRQIPKRFRRSAPKNKYDSSGSSSSSSENDSDDSITKGSGSSSSSESSESSSSSSESSSSSSSSSSGSWSSGSSSSSSDADSSSSSDSSSDSDSSSSSSSEEYQPRPSMTRPPQVPFLPFFVGYEGNSVQYAKDLNLVSAAKKLCSQIASELQNPSSIPQKQTLAKFSIVARMVRAMSADQLRKVTSEIYAPIKSSGESPWQVFRDAVATAGTGPALICIRDWINSKKLQPYEASEIMATLPRSARFPTSEYLETFFSLATNHEVTRSQYLNVSAILAFSDLVRKVQVNNWTAHNYYGVHAFGRMSSIDSKALLEKYIPYMAKCLRSAVRDGDSHSILVYIRALGNIAHPKILSVFEPYLEGREQTSPFQRSAMVASLNKLAKTYPKVAQRVLFNVYQNLGEAHEVRCVAVFTLMRTGPPAYMLQRMAEFTNQDVSQQVISAVQSAIRSAAALEGPHHRELRKNAAAAVHLLTPRAYGFHYSKSYLRSYMVKEMGLAYRHHLSWVGSTDHWLPSSLFMSTRQNIGGWKAQNMVLAIMTSSIDDITDAISDQFDYEDSSSSRSSRNRSKPSPSSSSSSHSPFTTDKIAEMLNIQPSESNQVEGSFLFRTMGTERFYTFDNHTIENITHLLTAAASAIRSGHRFNYSKLYNQYAITLSFATETGLPFVYTLKCPTYMAIRGEVQARTHPDMASGSHSSVRIPESVNGSASLHVIYSSRMTAKLSFVAPLTHQRYIAGLDKNVQVNLPIRASFSLDTENTKANLTLSPLYPSRDALLFHFSTWPYTNKHNILDLNPLSQGSDHKIIHVRDARTWENTFGKDTTGFAFRVKYSTEQKFVDSQWLWEKAQRHDAFSFLLYPWSERTIKYNNMNIYLDSHKTSSKSFTWSAQYSDNSDDSDSNESDSNVSDSNESDTDYSEPDRKSPSSSARGGHGIFTPSTSAPSSERRQKEFLDKASSGIRNASTSVLDMAWEFNGEKKIAYVATLAYADSEVDEKTRTVFYFHRTPQYSQSKPWEVCLAYEGKWPNVPLMNYEKALKASATSYTNMEVAFGESCRSGASKISVKAKAEQTQERKEYLRRTPLSQLCMSQMESGHYLLPACRNVTARANFLDHCNAEIHYERLSPAFKNRTAKFYNWVKYMAYPYLDENIINVNNKEGRMTIDVDYAVDLKSVNVSLEAPNREAEFNWVRVNPWIRPLIVKHPTYSAAERFLTKALAMQYTATCTLDNSRIVTFDNKTYPANLGKCWHVMMTTQPEESDSSSSSSSSDDEDDDVTILARDADSKSKEIKVILGDDVFDIRPSGSSGKSSGSGDCVGYISYNQKQRPVSSRAVYQIQDSDGETLAYWYALPSGALIWEAPQHGIRISYNAHGAWIMAGYSYRDDVIGLCGTYDGERSTDFTAPRNCILRDPKEFTASYAVPDQTCQGPAKDLQRRAASSPCYRKTDSPWEVISEEDYSTGYRSSRNSRFNSTTRNSSSSSSSDCTYHRTRVIEEDSRTCFSIRPLPACSDKCRATGKVEKSVPVHCLKNSDATRHYVATIKKGGNPNFSNKEVSKTVKITVPQGCRRN